MSNKNILKIVILCMVFACSIGIVTAEAPPNIPMGLYGDVKIGGSLAKADTIIEGKVGSQVVASTKVVNEGKYGDVGNFLGVYAASEGDNIDILVNGIKVTTVKYVPGESKLVNLAVPSGTSGGTSSGSGGGSGGDGVTKKGTATPTAKQSEILSNAPGAATAKDTTVTETTKPSEPQFNFNLILGIFVLFVIGAVVFVVLKKGGKL